MLFARHPLESVEILIRRPMLANKWVVIASLSQGGMEVWIFIPDQSSSVIVMILKNVVITMQLFRELLLKVSIVGHSH